MTRLSVEMLAADTVEPITSAGHAQLGVAVLAGIALIVLLITQFKLHPFLALTIGSLALGAVAGVPLDRPSPASPPGSARRSPASAS